MTSLERYIKNQGAILSGKLAEYLVKKYQIKNSTARKRIARLRSPIYKLTGLFADNQSLIYHAENFNKEPYFNKLSAAFRTSGKRCHAILTAINYHYGFILKNDLANYSFSPVKNVVGHIRYDSLIKKLVKSGILNEPDDKHYQLHYFLSFASTDFQHYKAIQFSKTFVTNHFMNWARNIGLYSFDQGKKNFEVGGFQFALTGPSYIRGLLRYKKSQPLPGFVIADILVGNKISLHEINFFIQKINIIRSSNPELRLLPILIVDSIDVLAMKELKKNGVLIANISEIFGRNYNELLQGLIQTITNAGVILKESPDKYFALMTELGKLAEGKTYNLRGDLFELAVGYYCGQFCKELQLGVKVRDEDTFKLWDIDVFASSHGEIKAVECKGYNYPIDEIYIKKYLSEIIPALYKYFEKKYPRKKVFFEIWSTGDFSKNATTLLKDARKNTKKYSINYFNKKDIIMKAQELESSKFKDILNEYFFKNL